ncbi:MAG: putative bifunctional diguanylate cyclase/phosphodiesterase, partial [Microthrixaceae bacterium]
VLGGDLHGGGLLLDPEDENAPGADALPAPVLSDLRAVLRDGTPPGDRLVDLDDGWLAGTASVQGQVRAALLVRGGPEMTPTRARALVALCREAAIGLRAVEQAEQNVRQRSEERFASLIDNSSDIVAILDHEGRITYVSPVARRLLGYPLSYAEGLPALELVHPDDRRIAGSLVADVRRGVRDDAEVRLRHVAGTYHWFEVVGVDLSDDPNIRGMVLTAREIGDRKAAEEQLQLSEARFKALVQRSSDLVLVVDPTEGIRYVSPSVATVVGLEEAEALGRPLEEIFRDSGTDWEVALRRAAPRDGGHPELLEFGFRNAMDEWVHLEATVSDLRAEPSVGGFVLNARDVTERTSMLQRLRYQATHDDLTGLPNRVLAAEELSGMLSRNGGNSTVAVVSVDLDDFKDVNDSLGLAHGDELLRAVADRVTTSLAFGDLVARVGGDEFLVVLERAHGEDRVLEVAERILSDLSQPFAVAGRELSVTASAGVAFDHDRTTAAEVLLRNADTAMYKAKEQGKRQAVVFEAEMHTASFDRLELRADLARAVETDQLIAHYQPIVDLQTHRVVGCEALVRWQHPRRGLLSPAIFVPLAEESGLIGRLGEWILERACRDLAEWRRTLGDAARDLTISVNLSAQELHSERLLPAVTSILHDTGLPADRLVLEVTESNLLTDTDVVQDRMERLRSLGARLAIDDFGTGYSSLGYIHRFAFDVLKIDRSFVEGLERPTNRRIVTAVIDLARELGVRVVAEGIEEDEQEEILVELGCALGQGFKFSRPVPAVDFARLLRAPANTTA